MLVYTLRAVHKLYTSQLIAVMVKSKKAKKILKLGNKKRSKNCSLFIITAFTGILNSKKKK
jgi:hypothetical protein